MRDLRCFLALALMTIATPALGQLRDLGVDVGLAVDTVERGATIEAGFIVSNQGEASISSYRVALFGSRDAFLDANDPRIGEFTSNLPIDAQVFRENRASLDSCALATGDWRIIAALEAIEPGDDDPSNDVAVSERALTVTPRRSVTPACPGDPPLALINAGLNDAWFEPETPGQGIIVSVLPQARQLFLAWFTFDVRHTPGDAAATLGSPDHRWLTAAGTWQGNRVELQVTNSTGGRFDQPTPAVVNDPNYGTMTLEALSCERLSLDYALPDAGLSGTLELQRVVSDNAVLCEALAAPPE